MKIESKRELIQRYHTVCSINSLSRVAKEAILEGYGVESSTHLTNAQLLEIIEKLSGEADLWRKRAIASIGAWLRRLNKTENINIIKAIACRAAGYENFNHIPIPRIRDIYYEFRRKTEVSDVVAKLTQEEINYLSKYN